MEITAGQEPATSASSDGSGSSTRVLTDPDAAYAAGAASPATSSPVVSSSAATGGSGGAVTTNSAGAGGLVINVTFDQSQSSLPAGFVAAINYVVSYYESIFTNPATINIDVGYGEVDGQSLGAGALGESETYVESFSYSQVVSALDANEPSATQQAAYATLPATTPISGGTLWMATAEGKALGLVTPGSAALDGYVGFSNQYPFSYSATATPAQSAYDFIGVAAHEISEVMGRDSLLGDGIGGTNSYAEMDLFRYSSSGSSVTRDQTETPPFSNSAYLSINNGVTNIDNFNTNLGGDTGDWAASAGNDAYLAFSPSGVTNAVTPADLEAMSVLGWDAAAAATVTSAHTEYVAFGGMSNGVIVLSGGSLDVQSGGFSIGTVLSGGYQNVAFGGTAINATIANGAEVVKGADIGATVWGGGAEYVESGGAATGARVKGGHDYVEAGGVASGTTLDGGSQVVYGAAVGTTLNSGAYIYLEAGGTASGAIVSGGVALIGGAAIGTTDGSAGYDYIYAGGVATGGVVSGGAEFIETGGVASGTIVDGGEQVVYGAASGTVLNSGTYLYLEAGSATNAVVNAGVAVVIGTAIAATIESAGYDFVFAGGTTSGTTISGGREFVEIGAVARGSVVDGGAQMLYGTTIATTLNSGGYQYVYAGGVASATIVNSGLSVEMIFGAAVATTDNSGGYDYVYGGGTASGTNVAGGGEYVEAGGVAIATVVSAGAQVVYGAAAGAQIDAGAIQYVSSGGTATGASLDGGYQYVAAGGLASATLIGDGVLEVASGGSTGAAAVTFATSGGGMLRLDDSVHFGGLIAGFGEPDHLDLADIASGASLSFQENAGGASGVLTVSDGLHTANLTLLGQYVTAQFTAASDGHGGMLIGDPPVAAMSEAPPALLAVGQHA